MWIFVYTAEKLKTIQSNEALPIVLFKPPKLNKLLVPKRLKKVELIDGKMINGTEFFVYRGTPQFFFCPGKNAENKCLVAQTFDRTQLLQCASEPTPDIQSEEMQCGGDKMSNFYKSLYPVSLH